MKNLEASPETMKKRHETLDHVIDDQVGKIGADDLEMSQLKRERLAIKDRIEGIR